MNNQNEPRKATLADLKKGVTVYKQMNPNGPWTKQTLGVGDLNGHNIEHLWQYLIDRDRLYLDDPQAIDWKKAKLKQAYEKKGRNRSNTLFHQ